MRQPPRPTGTLPPESSLFRGRGRAWEAPAAHIARPQGRAGV